MRLSRLPVSKAYAGRFCSVLRTDASGSSCRFNILISSQFQQSRPSFRLSSQPTCDFIATAFQRKRSARNRARSSPRFLLPLK
jgi:hypothetical protein